MQQFLQQISEMNVFIQLIAIFIIGMIPLLEAPLASVLGIALQLPLPLVLMLAILSNFLTVVIVISFANLLKSKFSRKDKSESGFLNKRFHKTQVYFNRYGVPGVSLLSHFILVGNPISAFFCILLGGTKAQVMVWQFLSIVLWGVGTALLALGLISL
ncbi:hypothetical protein [Longirhabdus pacifica]|uniref:hypothetical protein n=1 Tax=Longirhabdus pacifica TaxID=2305227 RepID=UPI001008F5AD|nr:hypothetical protein [Longirhabdus pacifica]